MSDWIKCSDRMPEFLDDVLIFGPYDGQAVAYWNTKGFVPVGRPEGDSPGIEWWDRESVTHWMPLPEPPDEA